MNMKKTAATAVAMVLAATFSGCASLGAQTYDDNATILKEAGYTDVAFQGKGVGCSKSDMNTQIFTGKQDGVAKSGIVCYSYESGAKIKAFPVAP